MAAATRDSVVDNSADRSTFNTPVSNDTELDIEVGKIAEQQKRETGMSEDTAAIKAHLMAEGFKRDVVKPKSVEDDMRAAHESTLKAQEQDVKNLEENPVEADANFASSSSSDKKSSKK